MEDLQAERVATSIGRKVIDAELSTLETQEHILSHALGQASKALYGKLHAQHQQAETTSKPRLPATKKAARPPTANARSSSPRGISPGRSSTGAATPTQPTGGRPGPRR